MQWSHIETFEPLAARKPYDLTLVYQKRRGLNVPPTRSRKQIRRLARLIGEGGRRDANDILLSTLTPEGRRTLHSDPDRLDEVNQEITDFGCEVVAQYAVLGSYDFITVIQAANNESVAHLSLDLGSRGTVNIVTLPAISMAQLRAKLKGPKQMGRATRK
jgi:uncharacterized protein with GYD domain